jgi:hypothetical protein
VTKMFLTYTKILKMSTILIKMIISNIIKKDCQWLEINKVNIYKYMITYRNKNTIRKKLIILFARNNYI